MSEELRTEEEQVEAIKRWWDENGKSTVAGIVVVVAGWFGWNGYQDNLRATGEAASEVYEQLVVKSTVPGSQQSDADKAEMNQLATTLSEDYKETLYGDFGSLFLAKFAIEAGEFENAKNTLQAIVTKNEQGPVLEMAKVRLARVLTQLGELDAALALVNIVPSNAFAAQYAETKGDILFAQGKGDEARTAFQQAKDAAQQQGINTQLLERKINDLATAE